MKFLLTLKKSQYWLYLQLYQHLLYISFIVFADTYFAHMREVRNRALVLKLTYWWN